MNKTLTALALATAVLAGAGVHGANAQCAPKTFVVGPPLDPRSAAGIMIQNIDRQHQETCEAALQRQREGQQWLEQEGAKAEAARKAVAYGLRLAEEARVKAAAEERQRAEAVAESERKQQAASPLRYVTTGDGPVWICPNVDDLGKKAVTYWADHMPSIGDSSISLSLRLTEIAAAKNAFPQQMIDWGCSRISPRTPVTVDAQKSIIGNEITSLVYVTTPDGRQGYAQGAGVCDQFERQAALAKGSVQELPCR